MSEVLERPYKKWADRKLMESYLRHRSLAMSNKSGFEDDIYSEAMIEASELELRGYDVEDLIDLRKRLE